MGRIHAIELHEQTWCPSGVRDGVTDQLQQNIALFRVYGPIVDRLANGIIRARARCVVDLCSGAGGPWQYLIRKIPSQIQKVVLTDFYPNLLALALVVRRAGAGLSFHAKSIDAKQVPQELDGFRTLFTSFHHFRPDEARAILQCAVNDRVGIGVFELSSRTVPGFAMNAVAPPALAALLTLFTRPFRWSRLFWTYVIPAIPLAMLVDGFVSCLRTYSPDELRALVAQLDAPDYEWDIGVARGFLLLPIIYLIGYPRSPARS